jgi:hypothetical protein
MAQESQSQEDQTRISFIFRQGCKKFILDSHVCTCYEYNMGNLRQMISATARRRSRGVDIEHCRVGRALHWSIANENQEKKRRVTNEKGDSIRKTSKATRIQVPKSDASSWAEAVGNHDEAALIFFIICEFKASQIARGSGRTIRIVDISASRFGEENYRAYRRFCIAAGCTYTTDQEGHSVGYAVFLSEGFFTAGRGRAFTDYSGFVADKCLPCRTSALDVCVRA